MPTIKQPSNRMLKVGEEMRHALSEIFLKNEIHAHELEGISVTVSEVSMSPDLKLATAYIASLGNNSIESLLPILNKTYAYHVRKALIGKLHLKFLPKIRFKIDTSFDEANKINLLLNEAMSKE